MTQAEKIEEKESGLKALCLRLEKTEGEVYRARRALRQIAQRHITHPAALIADEALKTQSGLYFCEKP